jgi:hypothetical protein
VAALFQHRYRSQCQLVAPNGRALSRFRPGRDLLLARLHPCRQPGRLLPGLSRRPDGLNLDLSQHPHRVPWLEPPSGDLQQPKESAEVPVVFRAV